MRKNKIAEIICNLRISQKKSYSNLHFSNQLLLVDMEESQILMTDLRELRIHWQEF